MQRNKYNRLAYIILLTLAIVLPLIIQDVYITHLFVLTFIFAIFALGYDIIIDGMGQFSFGHQALWGMGAYVSTLLARDLGVPVWLSIPAGIAGAALLGLLVGLIALRLRGVYLAIITLSVAMIVHTIIINWVSVTHGMRSIGGIPHLSLGGIELSTPLSYYYFAMAILILIIFLLTRMQDSRFGRALRALRENEDRAVSLGIPIFKYFLVAFTISAAISGLAGAMYAHYTTVISNQTVGLDYLWTVLIIVLVGGSGTIGGMILGSFIFVFIPEFLHAADIYRYAIFGALVLIFIVWHPEGIWPRRFLR